MRSLYPWLTSRLVFPLHEALTGRRVWTQLLRLREAQWQPPAELEARTVHKLRRLLTHAATHVPYYRDLFERAGVEPGEIRTIADLSRLPISTKAALRENYPHRMTAANLPPRRRRRATTSGSTGMPFEYYADAGTTDVWLASFLFFLEWAGAPLWDARVHIAAHLYERDPSRGRFSWGSKILRRMLLGERVVRLSGPDLTPDTFMAAVRSLGSRRRYFLFTFPSHAADLATQLLESGTPLPAYPTVVISYAEDLTPPRAARIARAFRCPVVDHYSSNEVLHMAQSCPDNPEMLHVNSERAIIRIVRQDGTPAMPGERGRVVVTDLANYVMPFINYDMGDSAVAGPPCSCGRGFPTLVGLEGREHEVIRTPGGKTVSSVSLGAFLAHKWEAAPYILEYQAVQLSPEALILRVVPSPQFNEAVATRLAADLATWLGPGMTVAVERVARIELEASGKRLTIKSYRAS